MAGVVPRGLITRGEGVGVSPGAGQPPAQGKLGELLGAARLAQCCRHWVRTGYNRDASAGL